VIDRIKNLIEKKFQLKPEVLIINDNLFVKVVGLDNLSLANWIQEEFIDLKIEVKKTAAYQFSNDGWIKIEAQNVLVN
jgi:hypothetical protein